MKKCFYKILLIFSALVFSFALNNSIKVAAVKNLLDINIDFREKMLPTVTPEESNEPVVIVVDTQKQRQTQSGDIVDLELFVEEYVSKDEVIADKMVGFVPVNGDAKLKDDIKVLRNIINSKSEGYNIKVIVFNRQVHSLPSNYCGLFGYIRWSNLLDDAQKAGIHIVVPAGVRGKNVSTHCITKQGFSIVVTAAKENGKSLYDRSNFGRGVAFAAPTPYYEPAFKRPGDFGIPAASIAADIALMYSLHPDVSFREMHENLEYDIGEYRSNTTNNKESSGGVEYYKGISKKGKHDWRLIDLELLNRNLLYKKVELTWSNTLGVKNTAIEIEYLKDDTETKMNGGQIYSKKFIKDVAYPSLYVQKGRGVKVILTPRKLWKIKGIIVNGTKRNDFVEMERGKPITWEIKPDDPLSEELEGVQNPMKIKICIGLWKCK